MERTRCRTASFSVSGPAGDDNLVVEHDQPEVVDRIEAGDDGVQRLFGRLQATVGHRAAAIEDDLKRVLGPLGLAIPLGCG
jgi:hypothetical protein